MNATKTQTGAASDAAICWSCRSNAGGADLPAAGRHFCAACGKIQPLARGGDYFSFFALPRKLQINEGDLEQRFHQLSWKLHPDNFVKATEFERNLALERSSQLNDAYRTLRDPVSRVEYLLLRAGVRREGATKQQAPPELLEEVFELNESLDELREARQEGGHLTELRSRLVEAQKNFQEKLDEVDFDLAVASAQWDNMLDVREEESERQELLRHLNEILNRRSYIRNLVRNVGEELAQA